MRTLRSSRRIRATIVVLGVACALAALSATTALARNSNGTWRLLDVGSTKPPARRHTVMIYDAAYKRVLMFGGDRMVPTETVYNDLWALELDCGAGKPRWVQLQAQNTSIPCTGSNRPCQRHGHVAALLPATPNRWFVHGGKNAAGGFVDDTWELSLAATPTWTLRSANNTGALNRYHHAAVMYNGTFRFHGGKEEPIEGGMGDTWSMATSGGYGWGLVSGNKTSSGPPCPPPQVCPERRYWHSLIVDAANNTMVVFGGVYDSDPLVANNAWRSPDGGYNWTSLDPVPDGLGRNFHTASYDPIDQRMVVVGGYESLTGLATGDATALTLPSVGNGTWSTLAPGGAGPGQIAEHAAVYDSDRDRIIVFGGVDENGTYLNDAWTLEFEDTTAPARVANLDVDKFFTSAVQFKWTAPGDDGTTGTACRYEIRYSANPITDDASFAAATLWGTPPVPSVAGVQDVVKITGLSKTVLYYIALKTWDESNNRSTLSNIMCARIGPPRIICDVTGFAARQVEAAEVSDGGFEFALRTLTPNPSSGPPDVSFSLATAGAVTLELLDLAGRRVAGLEMGVLEPGEHSARLGAGKTLAPGYYVVRLRQAQAVTTRPVMIVR